MPLTGNSAVQFSNKLRNTMPLKTNKKRYACWADQSVQLSSATRSASGLDIHQNSQGRSIHKVRWRRDSFTAHDRHQNSQGRSIRQVKDGDGTTSKMAGRRRIQSLPVRLQLLHLAPGFVHIARIPPKVVTDQSAAWPISRNLSAPQ